MTFFLDHLRQVPVLAVLRGLSPAASVAAAKALWGAGIELVEVTIQDDGGVAALRDVCRAANGHRIGAGSVTSVAQIDELTAMGVDFAVSPGLDEQVVVAAAAAGLPYLPGVATPSEVQKALALGCREMKLFPAGLLGGPKLVRALQGPFPDVSLIATGGVAVDELDAYLGAGAVGVGLGSGLTSDHGMQHLEDWLRARER